MPVDASLFKYTSCLSSHGHGGRSIKVSTDYPPRFLSSLRVSRGCSGYSRFWAQLPSEDRWFHPMEIPYGLDNDPASPYLQCIAVG
jgi:hypothetical protein